LEFSDALITGIMTASVTGAGLVIAIYALLARMSDRIFETRFEELNKFCAEVKDISHNPDSFNEINLKKTTARLNQLQSSIGSMKAFPNYLGLGVLVTFCAFFFSIAFCLISLIGGEIFNHEFLSNVIIGFFGASLFLFFSVCFYGIFDINRAISHNFDRLKKERDKIEQEIVTAKKGQ
jgi:hypothetical protein